MSTMISVDAQQFSIAPKKTGAPFSEQVGDHGLLPVRTFLHTDSTIN